MIIKFEIEYHTQWGEQLCIGGSLPQLGSWNEGQESPMVFRGDGKWDFEIQVKKPTSFSYKYCIKYPDGHIQWEFGENRTVEVEVEEQSLLQDSWRSNHHDQNVYATSPFADAFFNRPKRKRATGKADTKNIHFNLRAYRISPDHHFCIVGGTKELGQWNEKKAILLDDSAYPNWKVDVKITPKDHEVEYKYAIYDKKTKSIVQWEAGANRRIVVSKDYKAQFVSDEYFVYSDNWRGSGVAIPVFSLRTKKGFGVGEFRDLIPLVDWSNKTGMKLIQVLPVNDTVATHTWVDSYPYAAISVFALHPIFANIESIGVLKDKKAQAQLNKEKKKLNALETVDYEAVMQSKTRFFKLKYDEVKAQFLKNQDYKKFFKRNKKWLQPYAVFSYLRDLNGTPDFTKWKQYNTISQKELDKLTDEKAKHFDHIAVHYFIQYHLDKQLKEATAYARKHGVVLKGDIPIGIYRYSVDAWISPHLYNMDGQSGAPPDAFSVSGQNWGFPTYNWQEMAKDGYSWWKERLSKMADFFDVFRIDHILGFFRIWEIPWDAVEGTLGRFNPAIPYSVDELKNWLFSFDIGRMCRPYIKDYIIHEIFGDASNEVRGDYLNQIFPGTYELKEAFNTQRKVKDYFDAKSQEDPIRKEHFDFLKFGLFRLLRDVIFLEAPLSDGQAYNPNIDLTSTFSYRDLDDHSKSQLNEMHRQYFFHRHNDFWRERAMEKLPALKSATDMLVCGEDLGMVPDSVPGVMNELQMLSLAVQRMPNDNTKEFWHPADTPYLSVCSTGSHDTSTLRQWWEEDRDKTQRFYNSILGNFGEAPFYCEPWVAEQVIVQHLHSPSMWAIFPIQDILAMNGELRRVFPQDEHINRPEIIPHYWKYRFHLDIEELNTKDEFNEHLKLLVDQSGRG